MNALPAGSIEPGPRSFLVRVPNDDFFPELRKGSDAIVDPSVSPKDGAIVLARPFRSEPEFLVLTRWWGSDGRNIEGRFCKPGDPLEARHLGIGMLYSRQEAESGEVEILGTVRGFFRLV